MKKTLRLTAFIAVMLIFAMLCGCFGKPSVVKKAENIKDTAEEIERTVQDVKEKVSEDENLQKIKDSAEKVFQETKEKISEDENFNKLRDKAENAYENLSEKISEKLMIQQRLDMLNSDSFVTAYERRVEDIKKAVKNEDKDAIYNMFSQTAKDSGISDESIYEFIDFVKDDIDTLSLQRGGYEHQEIGIKYYIKVTELYVNGALYELSFIEYTKYDDNPDVVGVTQIAVCPNLEYPEEIVGEYGVYTIK